MNTFHATSFLSEIESGQPIPVGKRVYFQERFRNRLYDLVISKFVAAQAEHGLTQKVLAERIGKDTSRINKWLSGPGNWTIDTVSDLLLGICASEPEVSACPLTFTPRNYTGFNWFDLSEIEKPGSGPLKLLPVPEKPISMSL